MGLLLEVYFHAHFHDNWDNNSDDVNISLQQVGAQIRFGHLDAMVWQKCKHQRLLVWLQIAYSLYLSRGWEFTDAQTVADGINARKWKRCVES